MRKIYLFMLLALTAMTAKSQQSLDTPKAKPATNITAKVPTTSLKKFKPLLAMAGPVQNTPNLASGSSVASKWSLYTNQNIVAPNAAPNNCATIYGNI